VMNAHGALYPAKDACMSRGMFEASYPKLERFLAYVDPFRLDSGIECRQRAEDEPENRSAGGNLEDCPRDYSPRSG